MKARNYPGPGGGGSSLPSEVSGIAQGTLNVNTPADTKLKCGAGGLVYYIAGTRYTITQAAFAAGIPAMPASPAATKTRVDILVIDSTGTLTWTSGAEVVGRACAMPATPANKLRLAAIDRVAGDTVILDYDNVAAAAALPTEAFLFNVNHVNVDKYWRVAEPTQNIGANLVAVVGSYLPMYLEADAQVEVSFFADHEYQGGANAGFKLSTSLDGVAFPLGGNRDHYAVNQGPLGNAYDSMAGADHQLDGGAHSVEGNASWDGVNGSAVGRCLIRANVVKR